MIVGRPDNKIGNASYPIGKVSTGVGEALAIPYAAYKLVIMYIRRRMHR